MKSRRVVNETNQDLSVEAGRVNARITNLPLETSFDLTQEFTSNFSSESQQADSK